MFVLIILFKHVSKKFTYISYFAIKAFLHKDINFYILYTVCIYKSVSLSRLCPNVL